MIFFKKKRPENIIEELRKGNEQVIEHFYASGFRAIKKYVVSHGGDSDLAKDLYQEAILILVQKASQDGFTLEVEVEAYLMGICKNLYLDHTRKIQREQKSLDHWAYLLDDEDHEKLELSINWLSHQLKNLDANCARILDMYYFKMMSMREIAQACQFSNEDTAKTSKNRCLNKLREKVKGVNF